MADADAESNMRFATTPDYDSAIESEQDASGNHDVRHQEPARMAKLARKAPRIESGVWLVFYKVHTGMESISYTDSVQTALCFGWIASPSNASMLAARRKLSGK